MAERAMSEGYVPTPGNVDVEAKGASRRKSSAVMAANRRKSTVVVENPDIVEAHALSAADRQLAEMGYVQVSFSRRYL